MLFRKKENKIMESMKERSPGQSYWKIVQQQFRKNRLAVWSLRVLYGLIFIALLGDFIANEKPIYCKIDGETHFPVFRQYLVDLGLTKWDAKFINSDWSSHEYESVIFPPIPYSYKNLDLENVRKSPFEKQTVRSRSYRHWMGTDNLGRDVASGMVHGTRIALIVGIIAMGIATLIGVFFGGIAGFFGDDRVKVSRLRLVMNVLGIIAGVFYGFMSRAYVLSEANLAWEFFLSVIIFVLIILVVNLLVNGVHRIFPPKRKINLPLDILVMRLVEVMNSIPGLILLLALLAILENRSIVNVMIIIGLIGWTGITRFVRAELLRVRALDYVEAARSLGIGNFRILMRHALPNALTPILISVAFGIAGAIMTEAFISFLGIGIPAEEMTWGKLLNLSRSNISAWWLAIFPGMAIFLTVTIFNLIGEGLTDALNPKMKT